MRIKSLKLTDFQGVRNFVLDANLKDCEIRGANAVGKTTIFSAFCFLLYGLDSTGSSFLPKSIDTSGEARHGVDSSVEATFIDSNGQKFTLKKIFKEVWRRKHGSPKKIFSGHTVSHFWDSVPISEKEYKKRLSEIAPELVFKLLTSTRYFSESLHWQERRSILLDICGDISDEDIIKSNPALSRIVEILDGKSLEDQKKIITAQKGKLNKELSELPIRIDETTKGQSDITGLSLPAIEKELSELSEAMALKNKEALRIESGGEIAEKIKKQRTIEAELLEIENKISAARNWAEAERRKKVSEFETVQRKKVSAIETAREAEKSACNRTLVAIENREESNKLAKQEMVKLRIDWNAVNESVFDESSTICPTCGQNYPEEKADEIRGIFHTKKAETLVNINQTGRTLGADIAERKEQNKLDQDSANNYREKAEELTGQIDKIKAQVPEPEKETEEKPVEKDKKQEALELNLAELKLNIEGLRAGNTEMLDKVQAEIFALSERLTAENLKKQTLESHEKGQKRISELGEQQKTCATEFESLEEKLFIMDEFIKAKCKMLEKNVNSLFSMAEFKLFNILVNGQVEDCCIVTYQGIGWDSGLNFSSKIRTGLDIINTLSKHFQINLPIFIDSAESVTELIPTESQIIRLIVDPEYKQLTVKINE